MLRPNENFALDGTREDRVVVTGLDVSLQSSLIAPERDLVIRADTVAILDRLVLPGRRVHIFARQLECEEGAAIDVSGRVGEPDFAGKGRANDGSLKGPGQRGDNGANGGDGGSGGEIIILARTLSGQLELIADGGGGGTAQDGGNGAKGVRGADGAIRVYDPNRANGGNGGQGGTAGSAGVPGKGGDGGKIVIAFIEGVSDAQLTYSVRGGDPGAKGRPGKPGGPGDGGRAGTYWDWGI